MRLRRTRGGVTLLELLLATVVSGVLATAIAGALRQTSRVIARGARDGRAQHVTQEVLGVTVSLVEAAVAVAVADESAVALETSVAEVLPCSDGTGVFLEGPIAPAPGSGDRWWSLTAPDSTGVAKWRDAVPLSRLLTGSGCAVPDSTHLLVRVTRSSRLAPYRTDDGSWMLGLWACAMRCDAVQPVAGPIRAPTAGGWRVRRVPCALEIVVWAQSAPVAVSALARRC